MKTKYIFLYCLLFICNAVTAQKVITGAEQMDRLLPILKGKRVALVVNQTSKVGETHLLDTLLAAHIQIKKVFAPEHGFRGDADAGETIRNGKDTRTGIPILSLYGKNKKPTATQLQDIDLIVFDIQDVGARFYTYISTMQYVMEACAENRKQLVITDRPNPCDYVDGPVRQKKPEKFCGYARHPHFTRLHCRRAGSNDQWRRLAAQRQKMRVDRHPRGRLETRTTLFASGKTLSQPAQRPGNCLISFTLPV